VKKSTLNYPKEFPNCEHCGIVIDCDVNAAINIKNRMEILSLRIETSFN